MLGNLRIRRGVAALIPVAPLLLFLGAGGNGSAREAPKPVTPLLSTGTTVIGEPIVYPSGAPAQVTAAVVTLLPGQETGWHTHGVPVVGYVIDGELSVDYGEKGVRVYRAGDAVIEAIGVAHNGRNTGSGPMRILAVFIGAEGMQGTRPAAR
jgi:quercetin dioxygenase-like cupin family protein